MRGGYYHTGDTASRDADGYITYVGRTDDVFKASDYRISPFELESVLIEHADVAEAAVVPSPDALRLAGAQGVRGAARRVEPSAEVGRSVLGFCRERLAPFKRVRRIEFASYPRRSPARSAASSFAHREQQRTGSRNPTSGGRRIFPGNRPYRSRQSSSGGQDACHPEVGVACRRISTCHHEILRPASQFSATICGCQAATADGDGVGRQAVWWRVMALRMVRSLRTQAMNASFFGLPEARRRW